MSEYYLEDLMKRYPMLMPCREAISASYKMLTECFAKGGKLLIAGNGGSAADADHITGELMKGFVLPRKVDEQMSRKLKEIDVLKGMELSEKLQKALPVISLCNHNSLNTAFLNDVDGKLCFAQQVYGYGTEGDVLFAITTSGNSENILYAAITAKAEGMTVVGLTGRGGGKLSAIADLMIAVDETETYKVQELHLPIYHCLCLMVEERMFGQGKTVIHDSEQFDVPNMIHDAED